MIQYTKKQVQAKIKSLRAALGESIAYESEEDQEKEKLEASTGSTDTTDSTSVDDKDARIAELEQQVAELQAQLDVQSDDATDTEEEADAEESVSDDETEEEAETAAENDTEDAEEDADDEEVDESLITTSSYAPNTVGAVIQLLKKSNPNNMLFIQLVPTKEQCIITEISEKYRINSGITYMEIAKGYPQD